MISEIFIFANKLLSFEEIDGTTQSVKKQEKLYAAMWGLIPII